MADLEEKLEQVDPIRYKRVSYHRHEWDNIPPVVPRFVIHLQRYVEAISALELAESQKETTQHLRSFAETNFNVSHYNHKDTNPLCVGSKRVSL